MSELTELNNDKEPLQSDSTEPAEKETNIAPPENTAPVTDETGVEPPENTAPITNETEVEPPKNTAPVTNETEVEPPKNTAPVTNETEVEPPKNTAPITNETEVEPPKNTAPITNETEVEPPKNTPPVTNETEAVPPENIEVAAKEKPAKKPTKEKKEKKQAASLPPIIKKVKKHGHGHHGGAWKIAFADFVTAMMAFFLLMWLIASLNTAQKEGIAEYFRQPISVSLLGGRSMGERQINIKGGGASIKDSDGQVSATNDPLNNKKVAIQKEVQESNKDDMKKLQNLKSEISISLDKDPALAGLKKQLVMDVVSEGLRIQLIDNQNKPMFDVGSDKINPQIQPILDNLAKLLNSVPNKLNIQGHTDASPYQNPAELDYTNWELSSQRANAARRQLIKSGMNENKVMLVTGFSSTSLMDKKNPLNPENRRITILVMKKEIADKMNTDQ